MSPMKKNLAVLAVLPVCLVWGAGHAAAQVRWEASAGVDYSRGDYGGGEDTELVYAPVGLRATTTRWRLDVAVPYVRIEGPVGSVVGGVVVPGAGPITRRSGLGDMTVSATYQLVEPQAGRTQWEMGVAAKVPTADDDLGTGKTDYSVQVGVRQPLTEKVTLMGSLGYQWLGDPAAFELSDGPMGTVGLNYSPSARRNFGVQATYRSAYLQGIDEQVLINPYFRFDAQSGWSVTGYGTVGRTDSTPDFGVGVILGRAF